MQEIRHKLREWAQRAARHAPSASRHLAGTLWLTLAVMIVLAAALFAAASVLLPMAGEMRAELELRASRAAGQPVKIGKLYADWSWRGPEVHLREVQVLDKNATRTVLRFGGARMNVNVLAYLRERRLEVSQLTLSGAALMLTRRADGSIWIEGVENGDGRLFQQWLTQQGYLALEDSAIDWMDEVSGGVRRFTDVNLRLRSDGKRHQVSVSLGPRAGLKQNLRVLVDASGDLTLPGSLSGQFHVMGNGIETAQWLKHLAGFELKSGRADMELWGEWRGERLNALQGEVEAHDLRLAGHAEAADLAISRAGGELRWQRTAQGWDLALRRFVVARDGVASAPASLRVLRTADAVDGQFSLLRLEDVSSALLVNRAADAKLKEWLRGAEAHGQLHDARVHFSRSRHPASRDTSASLHIAGADPFVPDARWYIHTRFRNLRTSPWQSVPGVQVASGALRGDHAAGALLLQGVPLRLDFGAELRTPLAFDSARGRVTWRQGAEGWTLDSDELAFKNPDFDLHLRAGLEWTRGERTPLVNLRAQLLRVNIAAVSKYLPAQRLSPKALRWLDQALVSGQIGNAALLLRGRLDEFPFDAHNGSFEVRASVNDMVFAYAPGWPWLGETEAEVVLHNRGLQIDVASAKIFSAQVVEARALIPDLFMREPQLTLQGKVRGPTPDVLRLLKESPLNKRLGPYLAGLSATGQSLLNLDMLIPLSPEPNRVWGTLELRDSALRIAQDQTGRPIELSAINGTINFSDDMTLSGRNIAVSLGGRQGQLDIGTEGAPGAARRATLVELRTRATPAQLIKQLNALAPNVKADWFKGLEGETDWVAGLRLSENEGQKMQATLMLSSSLRGVTVRLPAPLAKTAEEPLEVRFAMDLGKARERRFTLRYGERWNGIFEVAGDVQGDAQGRTGVAGGGTPGATGKRGWSIKRGELRLGGADALLPAQGLRVSGEAAHLALDLDGWREFFDVQGRTSVAGGRMPGATTRTPGATADSPWRMLDGVDVRIGALELSGDVQGRTSVAGGRTTPGATQRFTNLSLRAQRKAQGWDADLDGAEIAGQVQWVQGAEPSLTMTLQRLHFAQQSGERKSEFDPRNWPALHVSSQSVKYGDVDLGSLTLEASKQPNGLRIEKLQLSSPNLQIQGTGEWTVTGDTQQSRLNAGVDSADFGKALAQLGYAETVAGGKARMEVSARWPGAPGDFALARLSGTLALTAKQGRFLEIEPGAAGRVFGLLSLQALPRRLTLDFRDLFGKGFSFDRIEGTFTLDNGDAYTNNLVMNGPAARISVSGRTGLAARDYDQIVTVTPEISAGLPLAGALGGPVGIGIGTGIYLFEKLFKPGIGGIARVQYTVKGSWQDPVIEPLKSGDKTPDIQAAPAG